MPGRVKGKQIQICWIMSFGVKKSVFDTILDKSKNQYLSMVQSITGPIFKCLTVLGMMLDKDDCLYVKYTGDAENI